MTDDRDQYGRTPPWPLWAVILAVVIVTMVFTILLFILLPALFGYGVKIEPL